MNYSVEDYRRKVRGYFVGKCVGGTLGMKFEGNLNVNNVTYYDPVPTEMVANDDLDLQVISLEIMRRHGMPVSAKWISEMWTRNMTCWPDEYGVAQKNVNMELYPPLSGYYVNKFNGGMGAAIRSELYACLAPADPDLAVRLCREDACTDHFSDGADACAFLTAVESSAFVESDARKLIEKGLTYITGNRRMTSAFTDVVKWWDETHDMLAIRAKILENYPSQNWTDVTINLSLIILAWLAGDGDFSKCICNAASMGYDADCTCATLGAILGTINIDAIEERWTWPIGDSLVLSTNIIGMHEADTVTDFCAQIFETCCEVQRYYKSSCTLVGETPAWTGAPAWAECPEAAAIIPEKLTQSIVAVKPLVIRLDYPAQVACLPYKEDKFVLTLTNPNSARLSGSFSLVCPDGFSAKGEGKFDLGLGESAIFDLYITQTKRPKMRAYKNPLDINLIVNGAPMTFTAGLVSAYSWLYNGEIVDMPSNLVTFGEGAHTFEAEFQADVNYTDARFVCQGTRPLRVWLNGELVTEHDDKQYVPAMHRCKDCVMLPLLKRGWNSVKVEVLEGNNKPGEFYIMFGTRYGWDWLNAVEWRAPVK